ncbi:MAG TPA: pyridoxal 5'-phosphate synthase glutaminase subunit PdxT [Candidatus Sulfomarinibacteraceae bacterium]|nr:pyridoxal 5'-phosphate synthase glutaminase subunit PdxT [Candidatus Sulfomarinibacteraceae bacterium]
MRCGVLALQGDFAAHRAVLRELGADAVEVRTAAELATVDALILPGGESTAMLRLMEAGGLDGAIIDRARAGLPVLATCAGVILLARATIPAQRCLGLLDVEVERNAYGRQVHSRVAMVELGGELGPPDRLEGVFIRAPRVTRTGPGVTILGWLDGDPVLLREGAVVAATFHPELTGDQRVHRLLLESAAS